MSDSTDRKPEDNTKEKLQARLAKYAGNALPPNKREDVTDLPRWVKTALVYREVYGSSYKEAAEQMGRTAATLSNYAQSPAGKKWREELRRFADDPIEVAKAYLSGNALNITLDRIAFLEAAKAAGDYSEGDKIARDLQDRIGITKRADKNSVQAIVVNLGSSSFEIPMGDSKVKEIPEGDYEVLDGD